MMPIVLQPPMRLAEYCRSGTPAAKYAGLRRESDSAECKATSFHTSATMTLGCEIWYRMFRLDLTANRGQLFGMDPKLRWAEPRDTQWNCNVGLRGFPLSHFSKLLDDVRVECQPLRRDGTPSALMCWKQDCCSHRISVMRQMRQQALKSTTTRHLRPTAGRVT